MESDLVTSDLLTGHEPGWGPLSPALSPRCGARGAETEGDTRFMGSLLVTSDPLTGHEPGWEPLSPALSPRCGARGPETEGTAVTHRRHREETGARFVGSAGLRCGSVW